MPTILPKVTLATRYHRAMTRLKQHSLIRSAAQFIRNKLTPSSPSFGQQAAHSAACPGAGRLMFPANKAPAISAVSLMIGSGDKDKDRQWIKTANAVVLRESSEVWKNFFDQDYASPEELLAAIPKQATQSPATIMNHYLALYPEKESARQWINSASAVVFVLKHPFFQRADLTGLNLREARESQGLSISINTLRVYLREISKIDFNLSEFMRFSPALKWWKENPKAHRRAKELIAQGAAAKNEFLFDASISNAVERSKIKPNAFLAYLAVLRRYVEERIKLPTSSPSAQRPPQF